VLQVFATLGIEFAEQARSVQLTERLDFLDCADLVVQTGRVIDAGEPLGLELLLQS
jgi:hypothetical protein